MPSGAREIRDGFAVIREIMAEVGGEVVREEVRRHATAWVRYRGVERRIVFAVSPRSSGNQRSFVGGRVRRFVRDVDAGRSGNGSGHSPAH